MKEDGSISQYLSLPLGTVTCVHQRTCNKLIGNKYIVGNSYTIFTFLNKRIKHDFGKVYIGHRSELHNYTYTSSLYHI